MYFALALALLSLVQAQDVAIAYNSTTILPSTTWASSSYTIDPTLSSYIQDHVTSRHYGVNPEAEKSALASTSSRYAATAGPTTITTVVTELTTFCPEPTTFTGPLGDVVTVTEATTVTVPCEPEISTITTCVPPQATITPTEEPSPTAKPTTITTVVTELTTFCPEPTTFTGPLGDVVTLTEATTVTVPCEPETFILTTVPPQEKSTPPQKPESTPVVTSPPQETSTPPQKPESTSVVSSPLQESNTVPEVHEPNSAPPEANGAIQNTISGLFAAVALML